MTSDLSGRRGASCVHFALDGTEYVINLTVDELNELYDALDPFMHAGRQIAVRGKPVRVVAGCPIARAVIRWADEWGQALPGPGRVTVELVRDWLATASRPAYGPPPTP